MSQWSPIFSSGPPAISDEPSREMRTIFGANLVYHWRSTDFATTGRFKQIPDQDTLDRQAFGDMASKYNELLEGYQGAVGLIRMPKALRKSSASLRRHDMLRGKCMCGSWHPAWHWKEHAVLIASALAAEGREADYESFMSAMEY